MSNQSEIIDLIKSISGQANILTIPRVYVSFTKSHRAALLLSQSVYWSDKSGQSGGWFYKSFREWRLELGLNQHAVETCVKTLTAGNWLETKVDRVGVRDTTFYRPNLEEIAKSIQFTLAETANVNTIAETAKVPKRKTIRSTIKQRLSSKTIDSGAKTPRRKKETPETDPRSSSSEIQLFREVTGRYPCLEQYDLVIECVQGRTLEQLKPYWQEWHIVRHYRADNIAWLTDWVKQGHMPNGNGNGNGRKDGSQESNAFAALRMARERREAKANGNA